MDYPETAGERGNAKDATNVSRNMRLRKDEMALVDKTVNDPVRSQSPASAPRAKFPPSSGNNPT